MKLLLLPCSALLLAAALCSCSGEEASTNADGVEASSGEVDTYGASLTVSDLTPIGDILADPDKYEGQQLKVEGTVVDVCEMRGCWINIGAGEGEKLRFKVEDGEMVFPMSAQGSTVVAEGVWTKMVTSVEDLREIRKGQAEEKGEEFDPASVTEPHISWQLKGLGARVGA